MCQNVIASTRTARTKATLSFLSSTPPSGHSSKCLPAPLSPLNSPRQSQLGTRGTTKPDRVNICQIQTHYSFTSTESMLRFSTITIAHTPFTHTHAPLDPSQSRSNHLHPNPSTAAGITLSGDSMPLTTALSNVPPQEVSAPGSASPADCQYSKGRGRPHLDAPCTDCAHRRR
jgi:hypothetical protein